MWQNLAMIAAAVAAFITSLVLFCLAIGVNFTDEGWSEDAVGFAAADSRFLAAAALLIAIAIVLFWIGLHRLSNPPHDPSANDPSD